MKRCTTIMALKASVRLFEYFQFVDGLSQCSRCSHTSRLNPSVMTGLFSHCWRHGSSSITVKCVFISGFLLSLRGTSANCPSSSSPFGSLK